MFYINDLYNIIGICLSNLTIKFSKESIKKALKFRVQPYSFNYIKDILLYFSIKSKCYELTLEQIIQLNEYPLFAQVKDKQEKFVLIIGGSDNHIEFYESQKGKKRLNFNDFKIIYSGYILIPLPDNYSGDPDYEFNIKKEKRDLLTKWGRIIGSIAIISSLVTQQLIFHKSLFIIWSVLLLLKVGALCVVSQILKIEFGESNSIIRKVCKTSHCSQVLTSKAAKIFPGVSMGDIGVVYFGFGIILLCFIPFLQESAPLLSILFFINLFTLPYTLFSVGYQHFIVKSWCPFCLSVMGILWLEFFLGCTFPWPKSLLPVTITTLCLVLSSGIAAIVIWLFIKKLLVASTQNDNLQTYVDTVKKDPNIFNAILQNNEDMQEITLNPEFVWGDPGARNILTLVLSPHCPSCIAIYYSLKKYASFTIPENLKIILRFITKEDNEQSWDNQVIDTILTYMLNTQTEKALTLLESWFDMKPREINRWKKAMNLEGFSADKMAIQRRKLYNEWFFSWKEATTPTIIFNQKIIPVYYTFENVTYLLNHILNEEE